MTVTVSVVPVTVPRPRAVMLGRSAAPAPVDTAAGWLPPEPPTSASAPSARTAALDTARFIGIPVQWLMHQGRSGRPKGCTVAGPPAGAGGRQPAVPPRASSLSPGPAARSGQHSSPAPARVQRQDAGPAPKLP